jgi:hypothetical protein
MVSLLTAIVCVAWSLAIAVTAAPAEGADGETDRESTTTGLLLAALGWAAHAVAPETETATAAVATAAAVRPRRAVDLGSRCFAWLGMLWENLSYPPLFGTPDLLPTGAAFQVRCPWILRERSLVTQAARGRRGPPEAACGT